MKKCGSLDQHTNFENPQGFRDDAKCSDRTVFQIPNLKTLNFTVFCELIVSCDVLTTRLKLELFLYSM